MFANPLNAIKKDGPNKTLIHTPELTKEEAKVMIAKLREAEILATYREVEPSGTGIILLKLIAPSFPLLNL